MGAMNCTIRSGFYLLILGLLLAAAGPTRVRAAGYLHAPSVDSYAKHDPAGLTILSNGRFLKPAGQAFPVAHWPHGLVMSRDGEMLFVASAGSGKIFKNWCSADPTTLEIKPPAKGPKRNRFNTGGADFSPDGRWLYWSGGEEGKVYLFDTAQGQLVMEIPLNVAVTGREYEDSFAVDLKISKDGRYLLCADVTNFRVVVVDTEQRKVAGSVQVGRYPYALAIEGDRLYVANIGLFEYSRGPTMRSSIHAVSPYRRSVTPAARRGTEWFSKVGKFLAWANPMCRNRFLFGLLILLARHSRKSSTAGRRGCWSAPPPTTARRSAAARRIS